MNLNNRRSKAEGVTLVTLSIMIIIILILAGVAIYSGSNMIKETKLEELKTNMLYVQAKARECVEDATFKMGMNPDESKKESVRNEVYIQNAKLQKIEEKDIPSNLGITDTSNCYWLTAEAQANWKLSQIKLKNNEKYVIQFDETNVMVEIYSTIGYDGQYSLTAIDQIQE